jgi:hypothetical protein
VVAVVGENDVTLRISGRSQNRRNGGCQSPSSRPLESPGCAGERRENARGCKLGVKAARTGA